jgi:hypothetical protein
LLLIILAVMKRQGVTLPERRWDLADRTAIRSCWDRRKLNLTAERGSLTVVDLDLT